MQQQPSQTTKRDNRILGMGCFTVLVLVGLIVFCRWMDYRFQSMSEDFPIDSCVKVDVVQGVIEYELSTRCVLVVKAFQAGRQSNLPLHTKPEAKR